MDVYETKPARGSSYIPTPTRYSNAKCGLINIKNTDDECFRWCMLYHQSKKEKNCDRLTVLSKIENKYDFSMIDYPATYDDIAKFEEINKVCIYIYAVDEENKIVPDKPGDAKYILNDLIYLLRIEHDSHSYYIYIKHIDRLFNLHDHIDDHDKKNMSHL